MTITLHEYQKNALFGDRRYEGIFPMWARGKDRVLLQMATGLGKTIVMLAAMDEILRRDPDARIVLLVDQEKLAFQPLEKAARFYPQLRRLMGVVMSQSYDEVYAQICVCSIASLSVWDSGRLERIQSWGTPDYVFIDECHHAAARTFRRALAELGALGGQHYWGETKPAPSDFSNYPQRAKLLGCTATPQRSDKIGLDIIFEGKAYAMDIEEAIAGGHLVDYEIRGFEIDQNFKPADYDTPAKARITVDDILSAANTLELVFQKFQEHAAGRGPAIGFCKRVAQAHQFAAYFTAHGVPSIAVDGTITGAARAALYAQFESGAARVIFNKNVLGEGYDYPPVDTVLIIDTIKTALPYVQRLGRGLRLSPGKTDCLVLDFCPASERDLCFGGGLDGKLPKDPWEIDAEPWVLECQVCFFLFDDYDHTMTACPSCGSRALERVRATQTTFWADGEINQVVDPRAVKMVILKYRQRSGLPWYQHNGSAAAGIDKATTLVLFSPETARLEKARTLQQDGAWDARRQHLAEFVASYRLYAVTRGAATLLACSPDLREVERVAHAQAQTGGVKYFSNKKSAWRAQPVTPAQMRIFERLRVAANDIPATKGRASQVIAWCYAAPAAERADAGLCQRIMAGHAVEVAACAAA